MPLNIGNAVVPLPHELETLLAAQRPQQGPDAKQLAMMQALQGAQDAPAATPPTPQVGDAPSAPPAGAGYYPGETGYMSDNSPAMKEYDNGVRYSPQSDIAAGEGTYEKSPGEDKAAQMAQDAIEGKGTTYPKDNSSETNDMEADATDYLAGQGNMTPEKFQRKYGQDLHEFLRADMGIPEEEMPQEAGPYDPNQMLRNATEGRRK